MPPTSDTSSGTLKITEDTADAIGLGISVMEGALAIGQMIAREVVRFASPAGKAVEHRDNDVDLKVSSGDELQLTWSDCYGFFDV